jgi:hypothetical protein
MPECDYCEKSFEDEDAYLEHLEADHGDELGRIDKRRLDIHNSDERTEGSSAPYVLGAILIFAVGVVGVVTFLPSSGGAPGTGVTGQQPTELGSVHYHGTMEMTVDGERIDFRRDRYQLQSNAFHFEGGGGIRWHVHARGVTLDYAMTSLGFNVTATSVTYEGTTYRDSAPNTTVTVAVNGQGVTPSEYVLQRDDRIRIVVERS